MTGGARNVQSAYARGRPARHYSADGVYYVTDEQFGYVGHLQGMMARERAGGVLLLWLASSPSR